jgi:hypothetical protein
MYLVHYRIFTIKRKNAKHFGLERCEFGKLVLWRAPPRLRGRGHIRWVQRRSRSSSLNSWYADHLSDAALEWLVNNKVITREQCNDAVAILCSISNWLEGLVDETKPNGT